MGSRLVLIVIIALVVALVVASWALGIGLRKLRGLDAPANRSRTGGRRGRR